MGAYVAGEYAPKVGALAHTTKGYIVTQTVDGIGAILNVDNVAMLYGLAVGVVHAVTFELSKQNE